MLLSAIRNNRAPLLSHMSRTMSVLPQIPLISNSRWFSSSSSTNASPAASISAAVNNAASASASASSSSSSRAAAQDSVASGAEGLKQGSGARPERTGNVMRVTSRIITVDRISTMTGFGRIFSYRALIVVGNGKGVVGYGIGKSDNMAKAVQKGKNKAIKNVITVPMNQNKTVLHNVEGKMNNTRVLLRRVPAGTGIRASKVVACVLECAGITNCKSFIVDGRNPYTIIPATLNALSNQRTPDELYVQTGFKMTKI